jgi:hypothetical protein
MYQSGPDREKDWAKAVTGVPVAKTEGTRAKKQIQPIRVAMLFSSKRWR